MHLEDTIAAISTPIGEGGIAIIRISGSKAMRIADGVVSAKKGRPSEWPSHTIHFAVAHDNGTTLDQVMVTTMRAPHTYTGEDVVEINCHGGILVAKRLLDAVLRQGARLAEAGEFSQRAFLNGRMDLTQAEAVVDLIRSSSERAMHVAVQHLQGALSRKLEPVRQGLTEMLAHIEAHIDFPEEDIQPQTIEYLCNRCGEMIDILQHLQATAYDGKILREGVRVAIVGRPNVGKSSLMNALVGEARSIVTPIPGTTRDTVEEVVNIRGITMRLIDTAGLREASDMVELEGVRRSRMAISLADLIIFVMDGSEPLTSADIQYSEELDCKPVIYAINKIDLPQKLDLAQLATGKDVVKISAKFGTGLEVLKDTLERTVWGGRTSSTQPQVAINSRHQSAVEQALASLRQATAGLKDTRNLELIAIDLRCALRAVGEITGHTTNEEILAKIFSTFCIGK